MDELIARGLIPLDKSWIIRMGILDIVNRRDDILEFLGEQKSLGDDLIALRRAALTWPTGAPVDVGESGTLYRLLRFASWKLELDKEFIVRGTLAERKVTDNPFIVSLGQADLLKLDRGTSQWASAAALLGDQERLPEPPFELALTYEAIDHWRDRRARGERWEPRYDATILNQARAFLRVLGEEDIAFEPEQAEDYCFARAFGLVTPGEGEQRWPALRGHESDRIAEVEIALGEAREGKSVSSRDHRVVQAAAMWAAAHGIPTGAEHPQAVAKSWPQFWEFLRQARSLPLR